MVVTIRQNRGDCDDDGDGDGSDNWDNGNIDDGG